MFSKDSMSISTVVAETKQNKMKTNMNKKLFKVLVSAAALLLAEAECVGEEYRATSPDKRNEIRRSEEHNV